jgi:hypothetical protein
MWTKPYTLRINKYFTLEFRKQINHNIPFWDTLINCGMPIEKDMVGIYANMRRNFEPEVWES